MFISSMHWVNPLSLSHTQSEYPCMCAICRNVWYQHATLACGHTFCRRCILKQMRQGDIRCAVCRRDIDAPPMVFNDAANDCLKAYFERFPREKQRTRSQEITDDDLKRAYERMMNYTPDYIS